MGGWGPVPVTDKNIVILLYFDSCAIDKGHNRFDPVDSLALHWWLHYNVVTIPRPRPLKQCDPKDTIETSPDNMTGYNGAS